MNISKNTKIISIAVIIIVLGLSFYAGVKYGQSNASAANATRMANFQGGNRGAGGGGMRGGGGTAGNIISSDASSITIGLRAGGSQIVFFSPSTSISTMASGTPADFMAGKQVVVQGTTNTDGSINATSIQVR
jgi:hypothetical protein